MIVYALFIYDDDDKTFLVTCDDNGLPSNLIYFNTEEEARITVTREMRMGGYRAISELEMASIVEQSRRYYRYAEMCLYGKPQPDEVPDEEWNRATKYIAEKVRRLGPLKPLGAASA